jgi:hypothetical protein
VVSGITEIAHITTKQDMSRWTRAHADTEGITWSVYPGPGGTMIIVEHEEDRCSTNGVNVLADAVAEVTEAPVAVTADGSDAALVGA